MNTQKQNIKVYGYTVFDGTLTRQIPEACKIRLDPDVPQKECEACKLDNKIHWCDEHGNKYCTKDILTQKAFKFDVKKWLEY